MIRANIGESAGQPDTARPTKGGAVETLSHAEAAALAGVTPKSWTTMVGRGYAPQPDDAGDLTVPATRRRPRWKRSTIEQWKDNRPGRGRKRTTPREARLSIAMEQVKSVSAQVEEITGTAPFTYVTEPGDGSMKIIFQDRIIYGRTSNRVNLEAQALDYVTTLLVEAQQRAGSR